MKSLYLTGLIILSCTHILSNTNDNETKIFLQNSYSFYADCFPDSTTMIIDKFISFCDREIELTENEKTQIKKALSVINPKDTTAFSIDKYYYWGIDNNYDRLVKGQPYISKLACILTEEKVELLIIKIKEHLNQVIKSKSQLYMNYWEKRFNKTNNIYYFSDIEEIRIVRELVFLSNNGTVVFKNREGKDIWKFNLDY